MKLKISVIDEAHRRDQTFIRPGNYVMLSVSDTGMGMDNETQSRIFEPFFTTKEKGKGTGLGLSTVYGIVKQSGGYVMVQSEKGARRHLPHLPAAVEGVTEKHVPRREARSPGRHRNGAVGGRRRFCPPIGARYSGCQGLSRRARTENGEAGIAAAAQHKGKIDLVITDVVMPGMGGRELVKQLAQLRPGTKVLYLSGYTEDAIINEGTIESGTAFLQKPFTLQNLSRKVREVLG